MRPTRGSLAGAGTRDSHADSDLIYTPFSPDRDVCSCRNGRVARDGHSRAAEHQGDDLQHASRGDGGSARPDRSSTPLPPRTPTWWCCRKPIPPSSAYYVNGLNARQNTTAWHGGYNKTCRAGVEPTCTKYTSESVMILTRLTTVAVTPRLIWAKDSYHVARATLRMGVALADGTQVNVFVGAPAGAVVGRGRAHRPRSTPSRPGRRRSPVPSWSAGTSTTRPDATPIVSMKQQCTDAWAVGGAAKG